MKYFLLGAFASAFFLYGIALVYGAMGTTNLRASQYVLANPKPPPPIYLVGAGLLLVGICVQGRARSVSLVDA